jgi:ABC-type nitrate/sulfonate/bicarbonate transport system substrate-binding protein
MAQQQSQKRKVRCAVALALSLLTLLLWTRSSVIAATADPAGSPEKTEIVLAYPQASGVFTPLFVANEAGLFKKTAST